MASASAAGGPVRRRRKVDSSMFYTYALKSKKNSKLYIGHTEDLERRTLEHNTNKDRAKFTTVNGPWKLVFSEIFNTRSEAMKREAFFKTGRGREYVKDKIDKL